LLVAAAPAARAFAPSDLMAALTELDGKVHGKSSLSPAERQAVHDDKALLIGNAYTDQKVGGVPAADVLGSLDCVDLDLQLARNAQGKAKQASWALRALGCEKQLAGEVSGAAVKDLEGMGAAIKDIVSQIRRGKSYGLRSTAVRRLSAHVVDHDLGGHSLVYGVAFSEHFRDLECVDVKVEAGRVSGASACIHRLRRLVKHANGG
jgi:hypothetical protein